MKNRISTFLAGMFTMLLLGTLTISALAISGNMTIEVSPINIQIDGEIFQPKDAGGNDVPVFVYNGTTYAPLRALAEAYGLEVGYDAEKNMASVTNPNKTPNPITQSESPVDYSDWSAEEEAEYQEFKGMWEIVDRSTFIGLDGNKNQNSIDKFLNDHTAESIEKFCLRFDQELYNQYHYPDIRYSFDKRGIWGWNDLLTDIWTCHYKTYLNWLED